MKHRFLIQVLAPEFLSKAKELSRHLGAPLAKSELEDNADFIFYVGEEISLKSCEEGAPGALTLDFAKGAIDFRRRYGHAGGQLIVKAVGGAQKRVIDVTAGLCRDAFILASAQCEVLALEKSKALSALVNDALERARKNEKTQKILGSLQFKNEEALEYLQKIKPSEFDVAYLDPMFPQQDEKSALPKKELRLVQRLVDVPTDDEREAKELFRLAEQKVRRIVVKRPIHGAPLIEKPSMTFKGSSIRFDVYLK